MVNDVLAEVHGTARLRLDCERDLTEVIGMGQLGPVISRGLERMIGGTDQSKIAIARHMAEHDPAIFALMRVGMQHPLLGDLRLPWITGIGMNGRLLSRHL